MDKDLHRKGAITISLEDFPRWASERIQMHEQLIAALIGRNRALEYGLGAVIGAHPAPEQLLRLWSSATPDLVDAEMDSSIYETEEYRAALQGTMAFLTQTMEAAAGRLNSGDEST